MTIGNETYESVQNVPISEGLKTMMLFGDVLNMFFGGAVESEKTLAPHKGDIEFHNYIQMRLKKK